MEQDATEHNLYSIEFELESTNVSAREKKYFYEGTVSGWIDKHQTLLTTILAIIAIVTFCVIIAVIYRQAQSSNDFDDEDCWPFSCPSTYYTDTVEDVDDEYYWEHDNLNFTTTNRWGFRLPSPTNRNLYNIIHFQSEIHEYQYATVGDDSTIMVSEDGANWILLPPVMVHV